MATCDDTQDTSQSKQLFAKTDLLTISSHSKVTKDTDLYGNTIQGPYGASSESTEQTSKVYDLPQEINSNLKSSLSDGFTLLKALSSIYRECWNVSDVTSCVSVKVTEFMSSILSSSESYEGRREVRSNELQNDDILDIAEGNITSLPEIIMKELRNHTMSTNLAEIGKEVEDSARAALSWFTPGK
jgi:hypothetical protein